MAPVRVLIVDDQEPFRRAATAVVGALEGRFEVVGLAKSGEEAIAAVSRLGPDLVLMDVNLPVMSGMDATRRIRALAPSTVVILLSTYDRAEYGPDADDCGAAAFIAKSAFGADALLHTWDPGAAGHRNLDPKGGDISGMGDLRPTS